MNNKNTQISETFIKIAYIFLNLTKTPMDYDDIYKCLLNKSMEVEYSKETFNKYLNTLRALGLKIDKLSDGKYHLLNFFVQIELNQEEISAFKNFEANILKYGTNNNIHTLIMLKNRILKYFDYKSQQQLNELLDRDLNTKMGFLVKQFEKICNDNQKIVIEYEGEILTIEPKDINSYNNIVYLNCLDLKSLKNKKLILKRITLLKQLPVKNSFSFTSNPVVYELSGRLAKIYKIKPNEKVIFKHGQKLVIKSENEDYEFLARRLARYQDFCKILNPADFKEYFKNYIDKILKLYEDENFSMCNF